MVNSFWFPKAITDLARQIDSMFNLISVIAIIIFVLVEVLLVVFLLRYRRNNKNQQGAAIHGNTKLEIIWTVIPAFILVVLGILSINLVYAIQTPPADVTVVQVIGHKWNWEFKYADGTDVFNEVRVPAGKNVLFKITSAKGDVIHGFYIPSLRLQQDALPGRETHVWMNSGDIGSYDIICDQYCGTNHSLMVAKIKVVSQSDYNQWLATQEAQAQKLTKSTA